MFMPPALMSRCPGRGRSAGRCRGFDRHRTGRGRRGPRWGALSPCQRAAVVALGAAELGLAGSAYWDLLHRPAAAVRGPRWAWGLAIAVNFVGPISYFTWGRRSGVSAGAHDEVAS